MPEAVNISGTLIDASLAHDGYAAWMAYVERDAEGLVGVKLAQGNKSCENWSKQQGGIAGKSDDILAPDGRSVLRSGAWRAETPALVYDAGDAGREWKLFVYKYFWPTDPAQALAIAQHYGVIAMRTAPNPLGEWSGEKWVLSPAADYPPPPYQEMVGAHLNDLSPDLRDVVTYARPSVIAADGILLMSLSAFTGPNTPDRVVMIASRDHGVTWQYVGSPISARQAAGLLGASLLTDQGKVYLAVATTSGTTVYPFTDAGSAKLGAASNAFEGISAPTFASGCPQGFFAVRGARVFKTYAMPEKK